MPMKFGQGEVFEEKTVQAILTDETFALQMSDVFEADYLESISLQMIVKVFYNYFQKHNSFPSLDMLENILTNALKGEGNEKIIVHNIGQYFSKVRAKPLNGDLKYIEEESLDFCKRQALRKAILESLPLVNKSNFSTVSAKINKAMMLGEYRNLGQNYVEDKEKRWLSESREVIPTPWPELNMVFRGGIPRKKLAMIMAPSGKGKSSAMINIIAGAVQAGFNAIYYTLELDEDEIGRGFDSYFLRIPINDVIALGKEAMQIKMTEFLQDKPGFGKLYIKELPAKASSINSIKAHLSKLENNYGFIPDIIAIDYADYLNPAGKIEGRVDEILGAIFLELKGLTKETPRGIVVVTASQTNRMGIDKEIVTEADASGAYSKIFPCDLAISLSRTTEDLRRGTGRFFLMKSRIGGHGKVYDFNFDSNKNLVFDVIGETRPKSELVPAISQSEENDIIKKKLAEKFLQMKRAVEGK